jgi:acetyl esterase/lipase
MTPPLAFDAATLAAARAFNRKLAKAPRFRVRNRMVPVLMQGLLRMSQLGADRKLARQGIRVERRTVDVDGHRVALRILHPSGDVRGVVLDIHGGGWVIGNACMDDAQNAALVLACGVAVVSVDYRLFWRTPLTGLIDDCVAAARWTLGDGLPDYADLPAFIIGESAGGHLAAAALLRLQAWPALLARVKGAVMYYGVYDLGGTPSVRRAGPETLVLDGPGMAAGLARLTPGLDEAGRRAPAWSPLYADLAGFPPALMVVGSIDPLLDDTLQMAQRWRAVAPVELQVVPEAPHGFIHFPTPLAAPVLAHAQAWIAAAIAHRRTVPA